MRRRNLLAVCASGLAPLVGGCSSLSGAFRVLGFGEISHSRTDDGVRVTVEVVTDINVEGEEGHFEEVILLGYSCETDDLICRQQVGTVTQDATRSDPFEATMECDRVPDVLTFDADPGPCDTVVTMAVAVRTPEGWVGGALERNCGDILPTDRSCEQAVGGSTTE